MRALATRLVRICSAAAILLSGFVSSVHGEVRKVTKLPLSFAEISPEELSRTCLVGQAAPALGSGLTYAGSDAQGRSLVVMMSDRGPQPSTKGKGQKFSMCSPLIATVRLDPALATATQLTTLQLLPSNNHTNLPIKKKSRIDPEGIAIDPSRKKYWIAEESVPSLLQVERESGEVLAQVGPGSGLPDILRMRRNNRGFESVAIDGSGVVNAMLQAPLPEPTMARTHAPFIPFVRYDLKTHATQLLAYPFKKPTDQRISEWLVGDLAWLSGSQFLVVETLRRIGQPPIVRLMRADIANASVAKVGSDSSSIDFTSVRPIQTSELLNLSALGWGAQKAEGITILPDKRSIVVVNDNDFNPNEPTVLWVIEFSAPLV